MQKMKSGIVLLDEVAFLHNRSCHAQETFQWLSSNHYKVQLTLTANSYGLTRESDLDLLFIV